MVQFQFPRKYGFRCDFFGELYVILELMGSIIKDARCAYRESEVRVIFIDYGMVSHGVDILDGIGWDVNFPLCDWVISERRTF